MDWKDVGEYINSNILPPASDYLFTPALMFYSPHADVPSKPKVEREFTGMDKDRIEAIRKLFEDRPIWSLNALKANVTNVDATALRR